MWSNSTPLLVAAGLTKSYPGVLALSGVDLQIRAGEIRALVGENGSGKSTLAKVLYGATIPDHGTVTYDGRPLDFGVPSRSLMRGIVAISQELTLSPELSVAENVLMGRLPTRHGLIKWRVAHEFTEQALKEFGLTIDPRTRVSTLSIELQQEVEICRALARPSSLIILDEATSSLSKHAADLLLEAIVTRAAAGTAVLVITHRMQEIRQIAHTATVLRDGILVGNVSLSEVSDDDILRMMVGRDVVDIYGKRERRRGGEALAVGRLTAGDGSFRDVSLSVHAGEIVGVAGLVGCGKSELALALAGAIEAQGEISIEGSSQPAATVGRRIRRGIALVPEDRKRQGLLPTRNVLENLALPWKSSNQRQGIIHRREQTRTAVGLMERLRIKAPSLTANIYTLSGGNQQKVLLARWLPMSPKVLILCEPTRGVDVGAKAAIYRIIQDLAAQGIAILLISSELPEVLGISDRILVMFEGEIVASLDGAECSENTIAEWVIQGGRE
jgi:ABC-type sugar transport system ATPase subunit